MLTARASAAKSCNAACIPCVSWKIALNISYMGDVSGTVFIVSQAVICLAGDASVFTWPWILSCTDSVHHCQCDDVFSVHLQGACSPLPSDAGVALQNSSRTGLVPLAEPLLKVCTFTRFIHGSVLT